MLTDAAQICFPLLLLSLGFFRIEEKGLEGKQGQRRESVNRNGEAGQRPGVPASSPANGFQWVTVRCLLIPGPWDSGLSALLQLDWGSVRHLPR